MNWYAVKMGTILPMDRAASPRAIWQLLQTKVAYLFERRHLEELDHVDVEHLLIAGQDLLQEG